MKVWRRFFINLLQFAVFWQMQSDIEMRMKVYLPLLTMMITGNEERERKSFKQAPFKFVNILKGL